MIILPAWAFFGLGSAFLSAIMFLIQDRMKVNGYALAFWNAVCKVVLLLPFAIENGFPDDPFFYLYLGIGAVMYAISDIIFFSSIGKEGAGAISRILPASVIVSFILWFFIKPSLLDTYLSAPVNSLFIFLTLCLTAFFAMRLKKCTVSMRALRAVWFVVFAASVGPLIAKSVTAHAPIEQGPFAYGVCEALMMLSLWLVYFAVRRPVAVAVFFSKESLRAGLMVGCVSALILTLHVSAYYSADNPAFVPAIRFLDAVIILGFYNLIGRKSEGDVRSGLGIVACATVLIILKSTVIN
ncbi:MAG: hypothetical protein ACT4OY_05170 [Alphaproteobacteria bacterium]